MATSPNYGWLEPDNTDLVKNGALAIRTLGNAIDTTMATMTPKSIVDAKGDLIAATANDTPARLAVGNNGETLVADSSTSTGLRYQGSMAAGRNFIINGGMDIWQRGTSFTGTTTAYGPDRFMVNRNTTGSTFSRQTSTQTGFSYAIRCQRDVSTTATNGINLAQNIESVNSIPLAGQTITLSFYAKAGANFSAASSQIAPQIYSGTGTDQNIFTGFTGQAILLNTTATLTTSFQRFTYTVTVGSSATQLAIIFGFTPVGTAGANDWFEVTGVQLEIGSVATQFSRAGATIQGELAACQRYYYVAANGANTSISMAAAYSTNNAYGILPFKVSMRTAPTLVQTTGTDYYTLVGGNTSDGFNSFAAIANANTESCRLDVTSGITSTQLGAYWFIAASASASLAFSAEL
jgi:hypothetical protein